MIWVLLVVGGAKDGGERGVKVAAETPGSPCWPLSPWGPLSCSLMVSSLSKFLSAVRTAVSLTLSRMMTVWAEALVDLREVFNNGALSGSVVPGVGAPTYTLQA